MQQNHSPLPWKANAHLVYSNKSYLVAEALSQQIEVDCLDAQFIAKACNEYYQNKETIKNLIASCRLALNETPEHPLGEDVKRAIQETIAEAEKGE